MTPAEFAKTAEAARRVLALEFERDTYDPTFMRMAIRPFMKTYDADPAASRPLLDRLLDLQRIPLYGRHELQPLAYDAEHVHDADALELMYRVIYGDISVGEGSVPLGRGSVVMSFVQDASQSLQLARHALGRRFAAFLDEHPREAMRVLAYVIVRVLQIGHYRLHGQIHVSFSGVAIDFDRDNSQMLDLNMHHLDDWWTMRQAFQEKLRLTIECGDTSFFQLAVDELRNSTTSPFLWRSVLAEAGKRPDTAAMLLPMATNGEVLSSYELGSALGTFFPDALQHIDNAGRALAAEAFLSYINQGDDQHIEHRRERVRECVRGAEAAFSEMPAMVEILEPGAPVGEDREPETRRALALDGAFFGPITSSRVRINDGMLRAGTSAELNTAIGNLDAYLYNQPRALTNLDRPVLDVVKELDVLSIDAPPIPRHAALSLASQLLLDAFHQQVTFSPDEMEEVRRLAIEAARTPYPGEQTEAERLQEESNFASRPSWGAIAQTNAAELLWRVYVAAPDPSIVDALRALVGGASPNIRYHVAQYACLAGVSDSAVALEFIERGFQDENKSVWIVALNSASRLPASFEPRYDAMLLEGYDRMLQDDDSSGERRMSFLHLILDKSFAGASPEAESRLERLIQDPWSAVPMARSLIIQLADQTSPQAPLERRRWAAALFSRLIVRIIDDSNELYAALGGNLDLYPAPEQARAQDTLRMATESAERLYYSSGVIKRQNQNGVFDDNGNLDALGYELLRPMLAALGGVPFSRVSYHVVKTLKGAIDLNPRDVLLLGCSTIMNGVRSGLATDGMAEDDIRAFVMRYVLDYRGLLEVDRECLGALMDVVDAFVNAGYPKWLQVVHELDGIYRAS